MAEAWETKAGDTGTLFLQQHRADLRSRLEKIEHCFDQLSEQDVWWRPYEQHNALGNIILHLCGNMRQWLVNGITQQSDVRDRPTEFSHREPIPKAELLRMLRQTIDEADAVLSRLTPADLLQPRRIQGFDTTVQSAVQDCVSHLGGHTQEIIWITRLRVGPGYRFRWAPQTPEQGAPA